MADLLDFELVPPREGKATAWCVVLHGLGDSMAGWRPICDELAIPGLGWILINAPEPYYTGFSWFCIPGMTDPYSTDQQQTNDIERSRQALSLTLAHCCEQLDVSHQQLIMMGFSQGCLMATDQALRGEQVFAGVIGISGWLKGTESFPAELGPAARQQVILWTHGNFDEVVPLSRTQPIIDHLLTCELNIDWRTFDKAHSLDPVGELPALETFLRESMSRAQASLSH